MPLTDRVGKRHLSQYDYPEAFDAYLRVWSKQRQQELVSMRAGVRLLKHIIEKYRRKEVVRGLFGSP